MSVQNMGKKPVMARPTVSTGVPKALSLIENPGRNVAPEDLLLMCLCNHSFVGDHKLVPGSEYHGGDKYTFIIACVKCNDFCFGSVEDAKDSR